jgi:hypothetical protein
MGFFRRSETARNAAENQNDEQAIERYRYLLRTAPPDAIEQAHQEAFSTLTPEQRRIVLEQLSSVSSPAERQNASENPQALARMATRAEIRQPGTMERLFGPSRGGYSGFGAGPGMGLGGMIAGSLLGSIAGTVLGSAIAHSFFDAHPFSEGSGGGEEAGASAESDAGGSESMDADMSGGDEGFGDFGGDFDV